MANDAKSPGQTSSHIVLRLARYTGTASTEQWQVLSLSDHGAECESDQGIGISKCKVSRRKPKVSLTICKPGNAVKQSNKRTRKRKNVTDLAAVLNNIVIPEYAGSSDSCISQRKDLKHKNVSVADCSSLSGVSKTRRADNRRSRTARILYKGSDALEENIFNRADGTVDSRVDEDSFTAVNFCENNCNKVSAIVPETLLKEEEGHKPASEVGVHNSVFTDDAEKIRKCRKVVPKSHLGKRRCRAKEKVSEVRVENAETESCNVVDVASVSKCDELNSDVNFNRMLVSRRSRPVKISRLMSSSYIFGQSVKTAQRRKNCSKKSALETVVNSECTVTEPCEVGSSQLANDSDAVNESNLTVILSDELNDVLSKETSGVKETLCTVGESPAEYSCTNSLPALDPLDNFDVGPAQNDSCRSECMPKLSPGILNNVSDAEPIPHEGCDMKVANVDETFSAEADSCKYDTVDCDAVANEDITAAESESPAVLSHMKYEPVNDLIQCLTLDDNTRREFDHLTEAGDTKADIESAEGHGIESVAGSAVSDDFSGADDSSNATEIQYVYTETLSLSNKQYSESCVADPDEIAVIHPDWHEMVMDAGNSEADATAESDCFLQSEIAGGVEVCIDGHERPVNLTEAVDVPTVDCDEAMQLVKDETPVSDASNGYEDANKYQFLYESHDTSGMLVTDERGEITCEASTSPPEPDFSTNTSNEFQDASDVQFLSESTYADIGETSGRLVTDKQREVVVEAITNFPEPDFITDASNNFEDAKDVKFLHESTYAKIGETAGTLVTDKQAEITDEASTNLPEPDFITNAFNNTEDAMAVHFLLKSTSPGIAETVETLITDEQGEIAGEASMNPLEPDFANNASNEFQNATDVQFLHKSVCAGDTVEVLVTDEWGEITDETSSNLPEPDFVNNVSSEFQDDTGVKFLHESTYADIGETAETLVTDKQGKIVDEASTDFPEPDFISNVANSFEDATAVHFLLESACVSIGDTIGALATDEQEEITNEASASPLKSDFMNNTYEFQYGTDVKFLHKSTCAGDAVEILVTDEANTNPFEPDFITNAVNDFEDAADVQFIHESSCAGTGVIVETSITDAQVTITDKPSTSVPELDFDSASDAQLSKDVIGETDKISHSSGAPSLNVTLDEYQHLHFDAVGTTAADSQSENHSVKLHMASPAVASLESSSPVKHTSGHHRRRRTHSSHKAWWKSAGDRIGEDSSQNSVGGSAGLLNGRVCREDKCEEPTEGGLSVKPHRHRRKSAEYTSAGDVQGADVKTGAGVPARKKRHDTSSRLFIFCLVITKCCYLANNNIVCCFCAHYK